MSIIIYYTILLLEILNGFWCFVRGFKYLYKQNKETKNVVKPNGGKSNILIVIDKSDAPMYKYIFEARNASRK